MKGLTTLGPCWSSETPMMTKPLSWYFLCNVTRPGISLRHGGHQVAQKSKITTFPLKSARLIGSPLISRSCQLGATGFDSAAGEVLAASKAAIERTAKIGGLTWFLNIRLCLLDLALGALGKRFYSRVRDATITHLQFDSHSAGF